MSDKKNKTVIIFGGAGQLGNAVVESGKKMGVQVVSVDFRENGAADQNVIITGKAPEDSDKVVSSIEKIKGDNSVIAVISVAGGWSGGSISSDSLFESVDKMLSMNLMSALVASRVAAKTLDASAESPVLILTGAQAALDGTSGMIAYGMSKAATHQLLKSMAQEGALPGNKPAAFAIAPITLDTASNREAMPSADFGSWTPLADVSSLLLSWATDPSSRPAQSGSVVVLKTEKGQTSEEIITDF